MLTAGLIKGLSRRTLINVLLAFLVVDVTILSYFQLWRPFSDIQQSVNVLLSHTKFQQKAAPLLAQVASDKERFWSAHSELQHHETEIPVDQILVSDGDLGPNEIFYDPRFTLAAYMDELSRLGGSSNMQTLPFHWVDWADVTTLNIKIGMDSSKQVTCQRLKSRIRGRPDFTRFCTNGEDLTDEELEKLGFRNREQLPKALVFDHCPHTNPSYNDIRVFMAKSYTMTHLPKPFKVVILNDNANGGSYEFMVNQTKSSDQRLLYSGMTQRLMSNTGVRDGDKFRFNVKEVYQNLLNTVKPHFLEESSDLMDTHRTVDSAAGSSKGIALQEKHFDYPKENIDQQIEEYESLVDRNIMQQSYLNGLKYCAQFDGTNEPTYFKMALLDIRERKNRMNDWGWHYDWRFFNDALFYEKDGWTREERIARTDIILERLLRNWNRFAEEKGLVSWIMHGPLLSWYWNGLMFPYDVDIDIQMPVTELVRLAKDHNQTLVVESPSEGYGRYLIDVGTFIHNRERSDTGNHIDARFIDVDSGVYIDITGLAKSAFDPPPEYEANPIVVKNSGDANAEVYNDRRKHFYTFPQLSPLRYTMMGGVPLYVPHEIEPRLRWEYEHGLDDYEFRDWYFVPKIQLWVVKAKLTAIFVEEEYKNENKDFDIQKMVQRVKQMSDEDALRLLEDDQILTEYYLTHKPTDWHLQEKAFLFTADGKDNSEVLKSRYVREKYDDLVGKVQFSKPLRKALYEYETYDRLAHH